MLTGEYVVFRFVPGGMFAECLNVKAVIVSKLSAIRRAKDNEPRRQNRQNHRT